MEKPKRQTTKGDYCEAFFHGEIWMRCRLCGKVYDAYLENRDKETGKTYCPLCDGYGRADNG